MPKTKIKKIFFPITFCQNWWQITVLCFKWCRFKQFNKLYVWEKLLLKYTIDSV